MSGLFGGGGTPEIKPQIVQSGAVETDAANAGLFERYKRLRAFGAQQTRRMADTSSPTLDSKKLLSANNAGMF